MAICVLSPISARKNATTVTTNTLRSDTGGASDSSNWSGFSAHAATAKNDSASPQRRISGATASRTHWPSHAATVWLASVATRMPAMIGHGLRIARGKHQCQQLRLVAQFADRDDQGGNEQGFQHAGGRPGRGKRQPPNRVIYAIVMNRPTGYAVPDGHEGR